MESDGSKAIGRGAGGIVKAAVGGGLLAGTGRRENPFFRAEFRRWWQRPLVYVGTALLTTGLLAFLYNQQYIMRLLANQNDYLSLVLLSIPSLLLRPSSIVPAILVWRALYSFREGPFFEPFRLTYVTPGMFVRGVTAVPVLLSFVIILGYTSTVHGPTMLETYRLRYPGQPDLQMTLTLSRIGVILVEGAANGMIVGLLTAWFGMRHRMNAHAVTMVAAYVLAIQSAQAVLGIPVNELNTVVVRGVANFDVRYFLTEVGSLLWFAAAKLCAVGVLYSALVQMLRKVPE